MDSALVLGWNLYLPDFPVERARELVAEYKRLRPFFYGDYYPLTAHSTADDVWMAYQFHREDLKEGMFLAFRRPESRCPSVRLRLGGLRPQAEYELDLDGERLTLTGAELAGGLEVTLPECPGSLLATYRQRQNP